MPKNTMLIWDGCSTCKAAKKKGMCKSNKCLNVTSKEGSKIANQLKVKSVPQCVTTGKNGKPKKCNTDKILKKVFSKK